jgi:hypothetical protein
MIYNVALKMPKVLTTHASRNVRIDAKTWSRGSFQLYFVTLRREKIDWAGLRAAAVAIGIRQAARQAARDLPPDEQERFVQRAMKRCSRQKWLVKSEQDKADAVVTSPTALSANVRKGSDVLSEVMAEDSRATRIGLSTAARKAAEHLAASKATKIVRKHHALRSITQSAAELHDWNQKHPDQHFSLNVLNMGALEVRCKSELDAENDQVGSG